MAGSVFAADTCACRGTVTIKVINISQTTQNGRVATVWDGCRLFKTEDKLPQTPTYFETRYRGEGGVSQVYWAHGYKLKKGISGYNRNTLNYQTNLQQLEQDQER